MGGRKLLRCPLLEGCWKRSIPSSFPPGIFSGGCLRAGRGLPLSSPPPKRWGEPRSGGVGGERQRAAVPGCCVPSSSPLLSSSSCPPLTPPHFSLPGVTPPGPIPLVPCLAHTRSAGPARCTQTAGLFLIILPFFFFFFLHLFKFFLIFFPTSPPTPPTPIYSASPSPPPKKTERTRSCTLRPPTNPASHRRGNPHRHPALSPGVGGEEESSPPLAPRPSAP